MPPPLPKSIRAAGRAGNERSTGSRARIESASSPSWLNSEVPNGANGSHSPPYPCTGCEDLLLSFLNLTVCVTCYISREANPGEARSNHRLSKQCLRRLRPKYLLDREYHSQTIAAQRKPRALRITSHGADAGGLTVDCRKTREISARAIFAGLSSFLLVRLAR